MKEEGKEDKDIEKGAGKKKKEKDNAGMVILSYVDCRAIQKKLDSFV